MVPVGSVHGRFQPFHTDHLAYVEAALAECHHLYIGITQFRRRRLVQVLDEPAALHRGSLSSNPLTYFERVELIRCALTEHGVTSDRYTTLPFPIEEPEDLVDFLPASVPIFTTTYDDWNRRKITQLRELGYQVINLWTRERKAVSGFEIRQLMVNDEPSWRQMVPASTVPQLEAFQVPERLKAMGRITG